MSRLLQQWVIAKMPVIAKSWRQLFGQMFCIGVKRDVHNCFQVCTFFTYILPWKRFLESKKKKKTFSLNAALVSSLTTESSPGMGSYLSSFPMLAYVCP